MALGLFRTPMNSAMVSFGSKVINVQRASYVFGGYAPPYDTLPSEAEYEERKAAAPAQPLLDGEALIPSR